ncbi:MAG: TerC family protein [Bacteroidetes bacterium]|nr:MAG: TerC family protein [Bacteroidota bacterium]
MNEFLHLFSSSAAWISLLTLTLMEIVLGIDNVIFISLVSNKLPAEQQDKARSIGISLALIIRVFLLMLISWIIGLTQPVFTLMANEISWRDIILMAGGLFLIGKSTMEIHERIEHGDEEAKTNGKQSSFASVIGQIIVLDIIFSFDSIITAVGLANHVGIMIIAVIISMIIMYQFAKPISNFIQKHPTMKMLALSFLIMIGLTLFIEALDVHVPKGYVYFAMAFSLLVETLNIRLRSKDQKRHN